MPAKKLEEAEILKRLETVPGWERSGNEIQKQFSFRGFPQAMGFVFQVAFLAESLDHHPDIDIRYKKVTLKLSTHSAGGLTDLDFTLAVQIETEAKTFA